MRNRNCRYRVIQYLELHQRLDFVKGIYWTFWSGKLQEIGIQTAIHQFFGHEVQRVLDAEHIDCDALVPHGQPKWQQVSDMIEVPMGEDDCSNLLLFLEGE